MRKALSKRLGNRGRYRGEVSRFGTKRAFRGPDLLAVCFVNITDENGKIVVDHLWLTVGKQLDRLNLAVGQIVEFDVRVTQYQKGYLGRRDDVYAPIETDYRLSYPTNLSIVS
jgi:hypothetical protein